MLVVVSYDVKENGRRNRLSKLLKNFGVRVQYSVFECELDQARLTQLFNTSKKAINPKEDSLRIYPLCGRCAEKRLGVGMGLGELPGPVLLF